MKKGRSTHVGCFENERLDGVDTISQVLAGGDRDDIVSGCGVFIDPGNPTSCYSLGEWYAVTSQNYDKARYVDVLTFFFTRQTNRGFRGYYEFACDNGHGNACFSLGVLYRTSLSYRDRMPKTPTFLNSKGIV